MWLHGSQQGRARASLLLERGSVWCAALMAVTVAPEAWSWAVRAAISGPGWTMGTELKNGLQKRPCMSENPHASVGTSTHDDMMPS